jgi:hypothetical protein
MHNHPFAHAAHIANPAANRAAAKMIDPRQYRNRPTLTGNSLNVFNARAYYTKDAASHRFDFRQLGHNYLTAETRRTRNGEARTPIITNNDESQSKWLNVMP